jgi:hypothetical protein
MRISEREGRSGLQKKKKNSSFSSATTSYSYSSDNFKSGLEAEQI